MKTIFLFFFLTLFSLAATGQMNLLYTDNREDNKQLYEGRYLKIFTGEKALLYADTTGNKLHHFKVVKKNIPGLTITVTLFRQVIKGEEKVCLQVKNPFPQILQYKAKISGKYHDYREQNVLDLYPGTYSIEYLPATVEEVILYDFSIK